MFIIRVSCILAMVETRASSAPAILSWLLANLSRLSANLAWLKAIRSWLSSTACVITLPRALGARVAALVDCAGCESGSKSVSDVTKWVNNLWGLGSYNAMAHV